MSLFEQGDFTLHSGGKSKYRINCDRLTDADIEMVAARLAEIVPPFGQVQGIPEGGLRLAAAMSKYMTTGSFLIVDDVWTTGASMLEIRHRLYMEEGHRGRIYGAVIFRRGQASLPDWVYSFADIDI